MTIGDQGLEPGLLAGGVGVHTGGSVQHAECHEGGQSAGHARLAGNGGLIHCRGEPCRIGEAGQRLAPCLFVRRREQDAIDVEDGRGQTLVHAAAIHHVGTRFNVGRSGVARLVRHATGSETT